MFRTPSIWSTKQKYWAIPKTEANSFSERQLTASWSIHFTCVKILFNKYISFWTWLMLMWELLQDFGLVVLLWLTHCKVHFCKVKQQQNHKSEIQPEPKWRLKHLWEIGSVVSVFSTWPHILPMFFPSRRTVAPPSPSLIYRAAVERVKTPCLHLSPEPYQYSWVCRVRLCDGCLISLWSPRASLVGALLRQQQSAVWSAERTAACIDLHILSLPSTCPSTDAQMLPTGTWIHASTVGLHFGTVWPQHCNYCRRTLLTTVLGYEMMFIYTYIYQKPDDDSSIYRN